MFIGGYGVPEFIMSKNVSGSLMNSDSKTSRPEGVATSTECLHSRVDRDSLEGAVRSPDPVTTPA